MGISKNTEEALQVHGISGYVVIIPSYSTPHLIAIVYYL